MTETIKLSRTAVRRRSALQLDTASAALTTLFDADSFSLRDAAELCYRLVGASAAALAQQPRDEIISVAYFTTESFQLQLFEDPNRDHPSELAIGFARALVPYIQFARTSFRLKISSTFFDCVTQVLERHAAPYLEADPDLHWDILVQQCWSIYDAVADHEEPLELIALIEQLFAEVNRVSWQVNDQAKINWAEIKKRNAPIDLSSFNPVIEYGWAPPPLEGDEQRMFRLARRLEQQAASCMVELDEYRRVKMQAASLDTQGPGIDRRRLYPDGPEG